MKGIDESSDEDNTDQFDTIITKDIVTYTKVELDHLTCPICLNVIWKPVTCGSVGCYSTFCEVCITSWIHSRNEHESLDHETNCDSRKGCPKCKRSFKPINIPFFISLLECLVLQCPNFQNGCHANLNYRDFQDHSKMCGFRLLNCRGCRQPIKRMSYEQHTAACPEVVIQCVKCSIHMTRKEYTRKHDNQVCIEMRVTNQTKRLSDVEAELDDSERRMANLECLLRKLTKTENVTLKLEYHTTFSQHFTFPNPTLIKPSFNPHKDKFDFLHFYIVSPIRTMAPVNVKWRMKINRLIGNLLLGFCSSMNMNSLDYIINKFGEIKKKEPLENKYRPVRKTFFQFFSGDTVSFEYMCSSHCLQILNETQNLSIQLDSREVQEIGPTFYTFYSMDTLNDSVSFL